MYIGNAILADSPIHQNLVVQVQAKRRQGGGEGLLTRWVSTDIRINKPLPPHEAFWFKSSSGGQGGVYYSDAFTNPT